MQFKTIAEHSIGIFDREINANLKLGWEILSGPHLPTEGRGYTIFMVLNPSEK